MTAAELERQRRTRAIEWLLYDLELPRNGYIAETLPLWMVACYSASRSERSALDSDVRHEAARKWRGFVNYLHQVDAQLRDTIDTLARVSTHAAVHEAAEACATWWGKVQAAPLVAAVVRRQGAREARMTRGTPRPPDALYAQEGAPPPHRRPRRK